MKLEIKKWFLRGVIIFGAGYIFNLVIPTFDSGYLTGLKIVADIFLLGIMAGFAVKVIK
jgi:hypothetical protein